VPARRPARSRRRRRARGFATKITLAVGGAITVLAVIFFISTAARSSGGTGLAGAYPFQVAQPGPGQMAPTFTLPATDGTTFDLAATRGKTVLLFFQEGIGCEPCWTQIKDIEAQWGQFQGLGIDQFITITTNPLSALKQKVADEGIKTHVLADERFTVSLTYHANEYGMMGNSADGHSFVLIGPDGTIRWRADYGGAPDYTMYVPVSNLIADIKEGLHGAHA
jgi:peroxiredoxin Q/BCP